ncbi:hypothetical protein HJG60_009238 [Phyllostomus discolor]|uniref:Uncharacterized protein n=1 Tax=Phyllostomus discolor TaxID=89673 RepID=A0A834DFX3_9CHIR|nr:hypothetical protein HJG60_009238 [Phyllostomus discolor]
MPVRVLLVLLQARRRPRLPQGLALSPGTPTASTPQVREEGPYLSWAHGDGCGLGLGGRSLTVLWSEPCPCSVSQTVRAECCGALRSSSDGLSRGAPPGSGEGGRPPPLQVFQLALAHFPLGWFPVIVSV